MMIAPRRRIITAVLPFVVLLLSQVAAAQQAAKKPITHEALWLLKRVGTPTVSPDGVWAAFSVVEPSYNSREQVNDLWIVRTDGSAPARRLTATRAGESGVEWSPDSRKLAFVAQREGDDASQIYVLDIAGGGEAVRVTSLSTGARSPRWRPDGGALLFTSSVYPGTASDSANQRIAKEQQAQKYRVRVYDAFPMRNWDRWLGTTQPHLFTQSLEPGSSPRDILAGTQLVASAGYAGVGGSGEDDLDAVWTPDGKAVVFAATTERNRTAFANAVQRLYRSNANGGEPQRITSDSSDYGNPRFSPNGSLYALMTPREGFTYSHTRLVAFDASGTPRNITSGFDRTIGGFEFNRDGKTVYMIVPDAGHNRIYAMPAAGGAPRAVGEASGGYAGLNVTKTGALVASWQSATSPPEIVRVDVASGKNSALTRFTTDAAATLDLAPLREFWFTSSNGKRIHNFVVLPPNFDESKKYPLFVVMHGGPHSNWNDEWVLRWNYHLLASSGYVLLLTNYTGSTGFSEAFARAVMMDPLKGPGQEINEAADEAIKRFAFIDATRQVAGGASYGGHLAYWMQASTDRYRALIAHAGAIDMRMQWSTSDFIYDRELNFGGPMWEEGGVWKEQNPILYAGRFRTPMLLTVGERDFRVPFNNTLQAFNLLQRLQIESRLLVFPDQNHWILSGEDSRFWFGEVHTWLAKHLAGPRSTN